MSKVIVLHATDNVATAVSDLAPGDILDGAFGRVAVTEPVPFGHKVALASIPAGETILKYGESIGVAGIDILSGACVHTHNVESRRGRGDLGAQP